MSFFFFFLLWFSYALQNPFFQSECFWFQTFWCGMSAEERVSLSLLSEARQSVAGEKKTFCRSRKDGQVSPSFFFVLPTLFSRKTLCLGYRGKQRHTARFKSSKGKYKMKHWTQSVPAECTSVSFHSFANQLQINEWGFIQMSAFVFLKLQRNINIRATSLLTSDGATSGRVSVFALSVTVPKSAVGDYGGCRCSGFAVDSLLSQSTFL